MQLVLIPGQTKNWCYFGSSFVAQPVLLTIPTHLYTDKAALRVGVQYLSQGYLDWIEPLAVRFMDDHAGPESR